MSAPETQDEQPGAEPDAPDESLRDAASHIGELKAYASQYVAAKVDSLKLSVRRAVIFAALGVVGLIALITVIITAVVLLISGLAQALTVLLDGRAWAGNLIAGASVLGALALGAWVGVSRLFRASRQATVKRYEQRLQRQRQEFDGHDAAQRSAERQSQAH